MDQDLGWWVRVALDGWDARPGPRYRRVAEGVAAAIERGLLSAGDRLPAERILAEGLGLSRGTVVRCFDELADAGLVERRQGAGTYVRARPAWTQAPKQSPASALLQRRLDEDRETIDLSLSVPAGTEHLPEVAAGVQADWRGHGLHPAGLPALRAALATHLTRRLGLPTTADQLIVTSGAQHALTLVAAAAVSPDRTVITACPTYPGLAGALAGRGGRLLGVGVDSLGIDVNAVRRAAGRLAAPVIYVDPCGHNPTGAVLTRSRHEPLLAAARSSDGLLVEDLAQAGLALDEDPEPVPPLAASDDSVVAIGSLSKMFWAGLRIGWIRAPAALRGHLLRLRSANDLAPGVPGQLFAARLLEAVDDAWHGQLRAALAARRDLLVNAIRQRLPAWAVEPPAAGLSLYARLPLADSETYAHRAARYGVLVTPGAACCVDRRHFAGVRLSIAESPHTLETAVDRLAAAWEDHSRDVAATRPPGG
ncbi:PLP-dependent aminotransferase family protein [Amycolatopsis sp. NPDC059027]|uniref:aminotransferase-like domain-containing protein n=1 Tax=Amycolatopsis sp. NPDC059027 TaxID=3346709 RepID=UPI00367311EA